MQSIFQEELSLITNNDIRQFVGTLLDNAPKAYFIREASSTNKYHPPTSRGFQGLVRHVKRCVYIANELFRNDIYAKLRNDKDVIIAALILHDIKKYGDNNSKWSLKNHAELAAYWIADFEYQNDIDREVVKQIAHLVMTHMGQWGKVPPSTAQEKFVHLCDYIASLKGLECEVEDMPVDQMNMDAKDMVNDEIYTQLSLDFNSVEEQVEKPKSQEEQFLDDLFS